MHNGHASLPQKIFLFFSSDGVVVVTAIIRYLLNDSEVKRLRQIQLKKLELHLSLPNLHLMYCSRKY